MRRLIVVLMVIGASWWAYSKWWQGDSGAAAAGVSSVDFDPVADGEAGGRSAADTVQPLRTDGTAAKEAATPAVEVDAADGYADLREATGERRRLLAERLRAMAGDDLAQAVECLGRGNSFLHSDEGRHAARRVVELAEKAPYPAAMQALTSAVERAMRGAIDIGDVPVRQAVEGLRAALLRVAAKTVLNPEYLVGARRHEVQPGEVLDRIAARFRKEKIAVESGTLALVNRIHDPRRLRVGQLVKVPVEPIRVVVEKRSYLMALYIGSAIVRLYWVGHGRDDCTPETTFRVGVRLRNPDWYGPEGRVIPYGHPDNILGDYFVKFDHDAFTGFGAHGTPDPSSIGQMASSGCLRLADNDIREFFEVVPRGAEVEIRASR